MKLGLLVNDIKTEEVGYTTTRLAVAAINKGHETWIFGVGDLSFDTDEKIHASSRMAPSNFYKRNEQYLSDIKSTKARSENICVDDLDILLLRNNPSNDKELWKQTAGQDFGRFAIRNGVIVLNDPNGLSKAMNKSYLQLFPEEVRPKTIITRKKERLREFLEEVDDIAILKPLQGSGRAEIFSVRKGDSSNLNQIIESIERGGYIIGQEYLPAAAEGDIRLFMLNGIPFHYKGKYAAFRRLKSGYELSGNEKRIGEIAKVEITDKHLRIAEIVRPKLVQDGMFLAGLDIVGDKLMGINVYSPGGLGSSQLFEKVNFSKGIIEALERKVDYMSYYNRDFDNVEMTTL